MAESFIKLIRSKTTCDLIREYPNAFILLTIVADRARREDCLITGLKVGESLIGDWENMGLTRQQYRTALKVLVVKKFLQITETCRNRKKSTTGSTTIGTKVKLLNSIIYDINVEEPNHLSNHRLTTDQPPANHEQEGIRRKKKEKKELPQTPSLPILSKIPFRELVLLTQEEHDKLLAKHGKEKLEKMLNILDSYKGSKNAKYDSDYHVLKEGGWVEDRVKKDLAKAANENNLKNASRDFKSTEPRFESSKILRGSNEFERNKEPVHG
jgi:hypothetical protein